MNIRPHKSIHVLTSPNTIFSAIEYRIKAQSTEKLPQNFEGLETKQQQQQHIVRF